MIGVKYEISDATSGDLQICVDSNHIKQVFQKLISNILKSTPTDGQVVAKLEENVRTHSVVFSVQSSGAGISKVCMEFVRPQLCLCFVRLSFHDDILYFVRIY